MQADIAGEPLQDLGQLIVRATFERRLNRVPFVMARPIDTIVLVLDVEQPDAEAAGKGH